MIAQLTGTIISAQAPHLLLEVQGVAYEIEATMNTFYQLPDIGQTTTIHTHLAIRDDAHLLFGFVDPEERNLFRTLIKINGVGAKMALTILSGISHDELAASVQGKDISRLVKLPGVGKKTAERLVVELKDRLQQNQPLPSTETRQQTPSSSASDDAVSALIGLGYKPQEASKYVMAVANDEMSSEQIIREALKNSVR